MLADVHWLMYVSTPTVLPAVSRAYRLSVEYRNNMQHSLQSMYSHDETKWFGVCKTMPAKCLHQPCCLQHGIEAIKIPNMWLTCSISYNSPAKQQYRHFSNNAVHWSYSSCTATSCTGLTEGIGTTDFESGANAIEVCTCTWKAAHNAAYRIGCCTMSFESAALYT